MEELSIRLAVQEQFRVQMLRRKLHAPEPFPTGYEAAVHVVDVWNATDDEGRSSLIALFADVAARLLRTQIDKLVQSARNSHMDEVEIARAINLCQMNHQLFAKEMAKQLGTGFVLLVSYRRTAEHLEKMAFETGPRVLEGAQIVTGFEPSFL